MHSKYSCSLVGDFIAYDKFVADLSDDQLATLQSITGPFPGIHESWTDYNDIVVGRAKLMRERLEIECKNRIENRLTDTHQTKNIGGYEWTDPCSCTGIHHKLSSVCLGKEVLVGNYVWRNVGFWQRLKRLFIR